MSDSQPGPQGPNPYDPRPYQAYPGGQVPFGPPPDHPEASKILILGILGFALCQVLSPFAWIMGNRVKKEIEASGGRWGGQQYVTVGWILGIVGSVILLLGLLFGIGYILLIAIAVSA
ncbi:DUF4190 domain-containing protein [Nocardioides sambongensis]|uniref:DUF4190 domain-containing protein n=1 Tax=Nocardioides sambongensis TaxID=2589074 RepID=UPI001E407E9C|nr:DUF4190 domain-containing protein [Nocardioides sambongensis]